MVGKTAFVPNANTEFWKLYMIKDRLHCVQISVNAIAIQSGQFSINP